MDHLASSLGMDPLEFRLKNLFGTSSDIPNPLPEIIPALKLSSDYDRRLKDVQDFNQVRKFLCENDLSKYEIVLISKSKGGRIDSWDSKYYLIN